jgi:iron complex outermembrane receptor protein
VGIKLPTRGSGRLAGLLAAAMAVVVPAAAQPSQSTGQLGGVVRATNGAPIPFVTIELRGPASIQAETDADGRFLFQGLLPGEYALTASLAGFAPVLRTGRVTPGGAVDLTLTLWVAALDQTTVTAAKTGAGEAHDTPMALSVLSGSELQRAEAHSTDDLNGRAPSVTFSQNTGFGQLTIRGIGTNVVFAGSDPSSAVYLDGVYLARPAMLMADFLDVERAEVLRGPQGTLYGRNTVGGAVNLVTRDPTTEFEASARAVGGNLETIRVEARVSGPIVRDRFLASAAFLRGAREGAVRDLNQAGQLLGGEDVIAGRGKLLVALNQRSALLVSGDVTHQDPTPLVYAKVLAVKPGFEVDNPADLYEVRTSLDARSRNRQYGAAARYTLRMAGDVTLTSLSAFRSLDYDVLVDGDITELDLTESHVRETQHQFSEELTVSQRRPRVTWIGGAFLFREADRQPTVVRLGGPRLENHLNPDVDATARAAFGQVTLGVTPRISATGGVRFTRETKEIANEGGLYPYDTPDVVVPGSAYAYTDRIAHSAWTPKLAVEVRPRAGLLAYGSASRGFKSGGFNLTSAAAGRGYAPEWAWSYESGLKTSLAGGRAGLTVAGFHTSYTDLQVQTAIQPGVIDISNAAEATIRGVELETQARLGHAWKAGGHLAWLDAVYDRYVAVGVGGVTGDVAGRRLTNAPEWSGRAWLEWNRTVGPHGVLSMRAESRWQSVVYFTPFNDAIQRQRAYGLLDVAAEFQPSRGCCTVGVFARNLTNEGYITGTFSSPPPAIGGRPGLPRQVALQVGIRR